jgi:hypothetical protein
VIFIFYEIFPISPSFAYSVFDETKIPYRRAIIYCPGLLNSTLPKVYGLLFRVIGTAGFSSA